MSRLPLAGVRVADFTRLLPGPWCTQMLADLGAEVIKVEAPPAGDPSRHDEPRQQVHSAYFASTNRNKRSIALDLRSAEGAQAAQRLIASADIVVESFAVGVAARLGIDYAAALALRPDIIYCSVTGFGQVGPLAQSPGHDLVVQAVSGMLGVGEPGAMPAFQCADYAGGAMAVIGVLAALQRRHATGEGAYLDLSMSDALLSMGNIALSGALARASGEDDTNDVNDLDGKADPACAGKRNRAQAQDMQVWGSNPRYALYRAADARWVAVSLLEKRLWARFCEAIGRTDLVFDDERAQDRHTTHGDRSAAFRAALQGYCDQWPAAEIDRRMRALDIPVCAVQSPDEALADEHFRARGMVYAEHDQHDGAVLRVGNPLARAGLADTRRRPPPRVGEHTSEVLAELDGVLARGSAAGSVSASASSHAGAAPAPAPATPAASAHGDTA